MRSGAGLPHPLGLPEAGVGRVLALRGGLLVKTHLNKVRICVIVTL